MLIICKCHGEKKEKSTLFKVIINGKNEYYCSESEYIKIKQDKQQDKQTKLDIYNQINEIFGCVVTNTVLFKELAEITKVYSSVKVASYIQYNKFQLDKFMSKTFNNEYCKIKYFAAILKNSLADYKIKELETIKEIEFENIENKYQAKPRKKSIDDYLLETE